jgi:hypothetical protein
MSPRKEAARIPPDPAQDKKQKEVKIKKNKNIVPLLFVVNFARNFSPF